jgi:O-antigen/teichoic acid export membrane protein
LVREVALSLVTRVVLISAGVTTSIITARGLGAAGRGEYFFVLTLAGLATQLGNLGLASSNTYSLAKDRTLLPRLAANSFWISLVVGTVAACIILGGKVASHGAVIDAPLWTVLLMVPTMIYGLLASNLFIGLSLIRQYNYFQLATTAFQLVAIAVAAWMGWGVLAFLLVSALAGAIGGVALAAMLSHLHRLSWRFDASLFRSQVGYAGKAYLATLLGYGVSRAGVLLIGGFSGKSEIGIYSVAVQFVDVLVIVPATVAMVLFPDLLQEPPEKRFSRTLRAAAQVTLLMAVLCVATAIAAVWIVPLLFGEAFAPAVQVLWWMLPGALALGFANIISQYLAALGIPPANVLAWLVSLACLLGVGSFLVPQRGAVGAAISLSLAYSVLALILSLLAFRYARPVVCPST